MTYFSDDTFEAFLSSLHKQNEIDLRSITFIDSFGMVGVLEAGRYLDAEGMRKTLLLPESEDVLRYLERMDFFRYAGSFYDIASGPPKLPEKFLRNPQSDVLLEITSIEKSDDIHFIVGKVRKRAHAILEKHLHYNERAIGGFIVALSEVCQNIIEHSENTGFVGIQKYRFQKREKNVVKIGLLRKIYGRRPVQAERQVYDIMLFLPHDRYESHKLFW